MTENLFKEQTDFCYILKDLNCITKWKKKKESKKKIKKKIIKKNQKKESKKRIKKRIEKRFMKKLDDNVSHYDQSQYFMK